MAENQNNSTAYATVADLEGFWRPLDSDEKKRAEDLLQYASDELRQTALNNGKNLDEMIVEGKVIENVLKKVVLESVKRSMISPIDQPAIAQMQQGAGPYSESMTFTNPSGDLFFKDKELRLIGLKRQKMTSVSTSRTDIYTRKGNHHGEE